MRTSNVAHKMTIEFQNQTCKVEKMENTARKYNKISYTSDKTKQTLDFLKVFLSDARDFLNGCKDDLDRLRFLHRFEQRKNATASKSYMRSFIMRFPRYWQLWIKQVGDLLLALIAMVVLFPILLIVGLAVKLTSQGPILYQQERVGRSGKSFTIYKFRTMRVDAEDASGPVWAKENDSRLTPIGAFLRKTHLDELPQILNILKGEMSLVGPRPERPFFVGRLKKSIPSYEERLLVKPGITGLAQVRHKYDETFNDVKKKVKYDILYIKKMCLMLDIKVLFWTVGVVLTGKGAR